MIRLAAIVAFKGAGDSDGWLLSAGGVAFWWPSSCAGDLDEVIAFGGGGRVLVVVRPDVPGDGLAFLVRRVALV